MIKTEDFHHKNPYLNFPIENYQKKIQGWNSYSPVFKHLIDELKPEQIIEVGTWLGGSALHMSKLTDASIVCVDTWLGGLEAWENVGDPSFFATLNLENGYPTLYKQFLANVIFEAKEKQIIPLPQTSLIAAKFLERKGHKAKLIYIDASHDEKDVVDDIEAWWPLVSNDGVLFGDDYPWLSVKTAVHRFASEHHVLSKLQVHNEKWLLRK